MPILANSTVKVLKLECDGKIYIDLTVEIKGPFKIQPFIWTKKDFEITAKQYISELNDYILSELNKDLILHLDSEFDFNLFQQDTKSYFT